jgi:F-type H+-transporting ATPase subunit delta
MGNETVGRRYAVAIFNLASQSRAVASVGRDLRAAQSAIYGNDGVRRFYLSPVFPRSKKEVLLKEAFGASLSTIALHALLLLVRKRREALLPAIASEYDKLALDAAGKVPLEIVTARELAPSELNTIVVRLARVYGKSFDVTQRIDAGLLGGVRITMGDRRVDGSLAGRLDDIARRLYARN